MDVAKIVGAVLDDLRRVASSEPNERLPKVEQIRCCIYATIRPSFQVVCAGRWYGAIEARDLTECDLWALSSDGVPVWLEINRCWSASGPLWQNKPPEQLRYWRADLAKLRKALLTSDRYLMLVGFFDFDALDEVASSRNKVVQNIRQFHRDRLVYSDSREFTWREGDGISRVCVWVWRWPPGVAIEDE